MNDLLQFNVFGEIRVKHASIIITATAVKSLDSLALNEIEIVDLENALPIQDDDPVRYLFATDLESSNRHATVKRQVSGPTLKEDQQTEIDKAIINITTTLAKKVQAQNN